MTPEQVNQQNFYLGRHNTKGPSRLWVGNPHCVAFFHGVFRKCLRPPSPIQPFSGVLSALLVPLRPVLA
jgi:hypothetical protein